MRPIAPLFLFALVIGPSWAADEPADLVSKLGAPRFADREAAAGKLRELGPVALPAVTAGCTSKDEEISARCKATRELIRADWRTRFAAAFKANALEGKHDHPVWTRFVTLTGDSKAARTLFGEMIANPENFARLDDAAADPARTAALYMEAVRDCDDRRNELMKYTFHIPEWPGDRPSELATMLFLGACFSGDPWPAKATAGTTHIPVFVAGKPLRSPAADPIAKLFVAWLDKRADEGLIRSGLDTVFCHALTDGLPLARRIAADTKLTAKTRAAALPVLGRLGTAADVAACTPLLADDTPFATFDTNGYLPRETPVKKRSVQVRDVAAAVALALGGADPRAHGFTAADEPTWREYLVSRLEAFGTGSMYERKPGTTKEVPKAALVWPPAHGFETDADRAAVHAKAKAVLGSRAKK
jgi:hypothetical protein